MREDYCWSAHYESRKNETVLLREFRGTVDYKAVMQSTMEILKNGILHKRHIGVISDYRFCELIPNKPEVSEDVIDFYKKLPVFCHRIKIASIIDNELSWFILYMNEKYPMYMAKPFITMPAALDWVLDK